MFARLPTCTALVPRTNKPAGTEVTGLKVLKKMVELQMAG